MKCDICRSKKAVIHIQQIAGKDRIDLHLCEHCAMERGISSNEDKIELSIANLLTGLIDIRKVKGNKKKICPLCGSSWEAIERREKLGCAECYSLFHREIRSVLEKTVGETQHTGKYPRRLLELKTFLVDVVRLKENLKQALKREDYEKAAALRDRIKDLEKTPGER